MMMIRKSKRRPLLISLLSKNTARSPGLKISMIDPMKRNGERQLGKKLVTSQRDSLIHQKSQPLLLVEVVIRWLILSFNKVKLKPKYHHKT